jgi:hypothetical protein
VQVTKVPVQVTKCHYVNVAKDLSELSLRSYGSIDQLAVCVLGELAKQYGVDVNSAFIGSGKKKMTINLIYHI